MINSRTDNKAYTVCLSKGVHVVNSMIVIEKGNITLQGVGNAETTLRLRTGLSSPLVVVGDPYVQKPKKRIKNVIIKDMTLSGGGKSEHEFLVDYPYLSNSTIVIRSGQNIEVRNLLINNCRSACVLTEHNSQRVIIDNNIITQAQWDGVSLNRADSTTITNNHIHSNTAAGITIEHMHYSQVDNNKISDNGSHGIYMAEAHDNLFKNNHFDNNHMAGVFLTCSIQHRDPVLCWKNSMSNSNNFDSNEYSDNRFAYQIAPDKAANCLSKKYKANISRDDKLVNNKNREPSLDRFGDCLLLSN